MGYRNLQACVQDLERMGQLVRIRERLDPKLEIPAIQRRLYAAQAPAVLFEQVVGSSFPMLANLFGTLSRCEYIFRDAISLMEQITTLAIDPTDFLKRPKLYLRYTGLRSLFSARFARPQWVSRHSAPVLACRTKLSQLPQLVSWPNDGGAYLTLPQVYSESPSHPGTLHSNLGMYRVQISGGNYEPDREAGLHYQIHRGLGIHHAEAIARGCRLPIRVWLGGPPAMTLAAIMPMPEDSSELTFAGLLGRRRVHLTTDPAYSIAPTSMESQPATLPIAAEADFCICGSIGPNELKMEGPFGDHLGYYSLAHPFPVMRVDRVYHRRDAIFPFTVVGRPPQEDTVFGTFIHRLTGPLIPKRIPGIREVHAVDAAGVHPLLLAIGQERYTPFDADRTPRELLTLAHSLLGSGQLSLAKYLLIASENDSPTLTTHDVPGFFRHLLERADLRRDLHFVTQTTIDTLDYTGGTLNHGSKLIIAATGPSRYRLATEITTDDWSFLSSSGCTDVRIAMPGVAVVQAPAYHDPERPELDQFCLAAKRFSTDTADSHTIHEHMSSEHQAISSEDAKTLETKPQWRWIVWVDDAKSATRSLDDFLWTTFTRSNPAADIFGVQSFTREKHWGCCGPLVIDARRRPYHAPELEEDAEVTRRIESLPSLKPLFARYSHLI